MQKKDKRIIFDLFSTSKNITPPSSDKAVNFTCQNSQARKKLYKAVDTLKVSQKRWPRFSSMPAKCQDWYEDFWDKDDLEIRQKLNKKFDFWAYFFDKRFISASICAIIIFILAYSALQLRYNSQRLSSEVRGVEIDLDLIQNSATSGNLKVALKNLEIAHQDFTQMANHTQELGQNYRLATHVLGIGSRVIESKKLIDALVDITGSFNDLAHIYEAISHESTKDQKNSDRLVRLQQQILQTQKNLKTGQKKLAMVNFNTLPDQKENLIRLSGYLAQIDNLLSTSNQFIDSISQLLNKDQSKYLLLFQNSRELRPTGGFLGTCGLLTIQQGQVLPPKIENTAYLMYLKREVYKEVDEYKNGPASFPREFRQDPYLEKINPEYWYITDANWVPDFETFAPKAMWLYTNFYHQDETQGAISIDPRVIEELLEVTGPVSLPKYNIRVDHTNFWDLMEYKVEVDNPYRRGDQTANPKQVLADFADSFWQRLQSLPDDQKLQVLKTIYQNLQEKHILVYSKDSRMMDILRQKNWTGKIKEAQDYFSVLHSTFTGKSAQEIKKSSTHKTKITGDGQISNEVILDYYQTGRYFDQNFDIIQVLVPKNAQLIEAKYESDKYGGFDMKRNKDDPKSIQIYEQAGKQTFAFKLHLDKDEHVRINLVYQLTNLIKPVPFIDKTYSLVVQKQPGTDADSLNLILEIDPRFYIKEIKGENMGVIADTIVQSKTDLLLDREFEARIGFR